MDESKVQEMQLIEQNLQNVLMQKQAFQMESSENKAAIKEIKVSSEGVYKIIGNLMLKSDKKKVEEELEDKQRLLDLRIKSLESQEKIMMKQLEKLRDEMLKSKKK